MILRIGFLTGGVFWGLFLICIGVLATLKSIFNLNIPLFRVAMALFIIYIGVSLLLHNGALQASNKPGVTYEQRSTPNNSSDEYTIIFGQGTIDLETLTAKGASGFRRVQTVFASGIIKVNPEIPARIRVNSAFAWAQMPDGNGVAFGQYTYLTKSFDPDKEYLDIEASVVFGELRIIEK